jgi:hypothetical protein
MSHAGQLTCVPAYSIVVVDVGAPVAAPPALVVVVVVVADVMRAPADDSANSRDVGGRSATRSISLVVALFALVVDEDIVVVVGLLVLTDLPAKLVVVVAVRGGGGGIETGMSRSFSRRSACTRVNSSSTSTACEITSTPSHNVAHHGPHIAAGVVPHRATCAARQLAVSSLAASTRRAWQ